MFNQHRMVRIFKAITMLKMAPPKTVKLLAKQLDTTERTVYRYIDMLKSLGFNVQKIIPIIGVSLVRMILL